MEEQPTTITLCKCGRVFEPHAAHWSRYDHRQIIEGPVAITVEPDACLNCRNYLNNYSATVPTIQQCSCCRLQPQEIRNLEFTRWRIMYRRLSLGEPLQVPQVMCLAKYDLLLMSL